MIQAFLKDPRASTTLEFAMLAPACIALLFGSIALGMAAWDKNILQEVAYETARCVALSPTPCPGAPSTCTGSAPGVCLAVARAADRGLAAVRPGDVALDPAATINGARFTTVTISYRFGLVGYTIALSGYAAFPNGG